MPLPASKWSMYTRSFWIGIFHIGNFCFWVSFLKQLLLRNCVVDFVEICNVYVGKMIFKAAKRIFNSDNICRSYSDLKFGVTFFGTQCIYTPIHFLSWWEIILAFLGKNRSKKYLASLPSHYHHTRRIRRVSDEGGWSFRTTLRRSPNDRHTSEVQQCRKTVTDSTSAQTGSRNMAVIQATDSSSKTSC